MITDLTQDSVSILTVIDGTNHRTCYSNSDAGRAELQQDQPSEIVKEVFKAWGDKSTVYPQEPENPEITSPPTQEERLSALEAVYLDSILGGIL